MATLYFPLLPKPLPRRIKELIVHIDVGDGSYREPVLDKSNIDIDSFNEWLDSITYENYESVGSYTLDWSNTELNDWYSTSPTFYVQKVKIKTDSSSSDQGYATWGYDAEKNEVIELEEGISYECLIVKTVISDWYYGSDSISIKYEENVFVRDTDGNLVWRDEEEIFAISDEINKHFFIDKERYPDFDNKYPNIEFDGLFSVGTSTSVNYVGNTMVSTPFVGGLYLNYVFGQYRAGGLVAWMLKGEFPVYCFPIFISKKYPLEQQITANKYIYRAEAPGYATLSTSSMTEGEEIPLRHATKDDLFKLQNFIDADGHYSDSGFPLSIYNSDEDVPDYYIETLDEIIATYANYVWFKTQAPKPDFKSTLLEEILNNDVSGLWEYLQSYDEECCNESKDFIRQLIENPSIAVDSQERCDEIAYHFYDFGMEMAAQIDGEFNSEKLYADDDKVLSAFSGWYDDLITNFLIMSFPNNFGDDAAVTPYRLIYTDNTAKQQIIYEDIIYAENSNHIVFLPNVSNKINQIPEPQKRLIAIPLYFGESIVRGGVKATELLTEEPKPVIKPLAECTWQEIDEISKSGKASEYFAIGDEKDIELDTGEIITMVIIGFDHDDLSDSSGKAGITFGMKNCLATNDGGWKSSQMRTSTMETLYGYLPEEVKAVIKPVDKKTSAGHMSRSIDTTSDKLFLFSQEEVMGTINRATTRQNSFSGEGSQYEYFKNAPIPKPTTGTAFSELAGTGCFYTTDTTAANGYINKFGESNSISEKQYYNYNNAKAGGNTGKTAVDWFLRSPYYHNIMSFCYIVDTGYSFSTDADYSHVVAFGFCV